MDAKVILPLFLLLCVSLVSCTGARVSLKFDDLEHPASMSPYLFTTGGQVVSPGQGLTVVKHWTFEKKFWSIGYSQLELTDDREVAQSMNEAIKANRGYGIVNFKSTSEACGFYYVPLLNLLPVWPDCLDVKFEGDIVR